MWRCGFIGTTFEQFTLNLPTTSDNGIGYKRERVVDY